MATMDLIQHKNGQAANFMDISGKVDPEAINFGFQLLAHNHDVDVIFMNIFGGIVDCQKIAQGLITAIHQIDAAKQRHLKGKAFGPPHHMGSKELLRETYFQFDKDFSIQPIVVRLNGTNALKGIELIEEFCEMHPQYDIRVDQNFDKSVE